MKKAIFLSAIFLSLFTPLEISISLKGRTRFLTGFTATARAETSLKAEVDKKAITTDENITYKLTITSTDKSILKPQLPKFKGLAVISQVQSSSISLVKGGIKSILVYAFILAPTDIGKFKIEPSSIKIKNQTYSTEAFEIEVTPGKRKPKVPQKEETPLPKEPQSESAEPQITL